MGKYVTGSRVPPNCVIKDSSLVFHELIIELTTSRTYARTSFDTRRVFIRTRLLIMYFLSVKLFDPIDVFPISQLLTSVALFFSIQGLRTFLEYKINKLRTYEKWNF